MKVIVPVKQVPDVAELRIDPVTHNLIREGVPSILNPYDRIAVEEAIRIKEQHGGHVTVVTMGPPWAKDVLVECLAMGSDEAVLLSDRLFAGADTLATAWPIADMVRTMEYDIILCGRKAIDAETGQVGPQIAELLGIPHITYISQLTIYPEKKLVRVRRELDDRYEVLEGPIPILLTVDRLLNEPRLPSLQGIIRAKMTRIKTLTAAELGKDHSHYGLKGSPTIVSKVFTPTPRKGGQIILQDQKEAIRKAIREMIQKGAVKIR